MDLPLYLFEQLALEELAGSQHQYQTVEADNCRGEDQGEPDAVDDSVERASAISSRLILTRF